MKLSELEFCLEDFLTYCQSKGLSLKTIAAYEQSLKLFVVYLKNEHEVERINDVRTGHLRQYILYVQQRGKYSVVNTEASKMVNFPERRTDYKKPVSNVTVNNYTRNIKVFFNWLRQEGELSKNPFESVTPIRTVRRKKVGLGHDEFKRLLEQFDYTTFHGYRNKVIVMLLQDTGMRISECLEILVESIDFQHKMILLSKTKGNKERYIYYSPVMARELKHYLKFKDRYTETELLFPTRKGTRLTVHSFEKQLRDASNRIGLHVYPHLLRNNFARHYLLNGGDFYTLSRILGHSSVTVTEEAYMDLSHEEIGQKYQNHSPLGKWKAE
ncbi:tyrosine-type recombinase/integrase [Alicyclobacillus dauci]|uniref:Tyrosine-type recombinase/integrase n=1 Tax=Alicyclobacillus dauci TaxID=1475485 RepID=A0ABY6Z8X9_9BACL|nr:tyrosine-type recombinase/integrase [Alicyclobacillus dauci]WAH39022.1 tyrosine-type recombinase/integrase [Alicyclobacillus dauci]